MDAQSTIWPVLFSPEKAAAITSAMRLLVMSGVTPEEISTAIQAIDRETSIGPMLNPTAYLDGRRFDNAREYCDVLRALHGLVVAFAPVRAKLEELRS